MRRTELVRPDVVSRVVTLFSLKSEVTTLARCCTKEVNAVKCPSTGDVLQRISYRGCSTGDVLPGMFYRRYSTGDVLRGMFYGEFPTGDVLHRRFYKKI
jgi:hypothetical protein